MPKSTQRRTILMADDDGEDCSLVRDALRETGRPCELQFVHNGDELFDYLRHQGDFEDGRNAPTPDLILLDLKMPRKDGRETLRDLKSHPRWRSIPVIALTAAASEHDRRRGIQAGFHKYITKPVKVDELLTVLEDLLTPSPE